MLLPSLYSLFSLLPRPPTSTLFPYTTLFRSRVSIQRARREKRNSIGTITLNPSARACSVAISQYFPAAGNRTHRRSRRWRRSEEHTSELQSLTNLVCRLLLEKKNKKQKQMIQ